MADSIGDVRRGPAFSSNHASQTSSAEPTSNAKPYAWIVSEIFPHHCGPRHHLRAYTHIDSYRTYSYKTGTGIRDRKLTVPLYEDRTSSAQGSLQVI